MTQTQILGMCESWPSPCRYDIDSCHVAPLDHGHQFCEISRSNMSVRSYGSDMDFGCVHIVTLTLEIHTLGSWTIIVHNIMRSDNGVRSYGPDTMRTDGQTDRYTPKTWFAGGIINHNGSIPRNACVAWLPRKCDYHQTDRQTDKLTDGQTDTGQSDPYVRLCFAGDTTNEMQLHSHTPKHLPITLTFDLCPTKSIGFIL